MNFNKRLINLMLTTVLFICCCAVSASAAGETVQGIGFVNTNNLRLRSDSTINSKILDTAPKSDCVVVLSRNGDWYKVNYNLQEGYMHKNYLNVLTRENAELGYGKVNGSGVNIRSGAGTSYRSVAVASKDSKCYILGLNDGWYKVIYNNTIGYIRSDYVDLTEIPYENKDPNKEPLFFKGGQSTGRPVSPDALNGASAAAIIATAKQYIGVPYVWGGSTPSGFDCSGFVQYVFARHGITLPRTSRDQYSVGTWVSKSNLQPGDLVFYNTSGSGVSHLGIYIGNGQFIHASSSKGVMISEMSNSYWSARYYGARRIL